MSLIFVVLENKTIGPDLLLFVNLVDILSRLKVFEYLFLNLYKIIITWSLNTCWYNKLAFQAINENDHAVF